MDERGPLMGANMVQLAICYQQLSARLNRALKPLDLNMTRISILTHYARHTGVSHTVGELAETMEMNQPAVTKAVRAMSEAGWLKRSIDGADARIVHVTMAPAGEKQLRRAHRVCGPVLAQSFSLLSTDDLGHLATLLGRLREGIVAAA